MKDFIGWMGEAKFIGEGDTPSAFSPIDLFGDDEVGGWWDASDLSTLFISTDDSDPVEVATDAVGQWKDKSGNGNHLTEATNKPTWQGANGVRFDGTNDILWRSSVLGLYTAGACSMFLAGKITGTAAALVINEASSTDNDPIYSLCRSAGGTAADLTTFIRRDDNTVITASTLLAGVLDGTRRVIGSIDAGTSWTGYNNGVAGTPVSVTRSGTLAGMDRFSVGGLRRAAASSWMAMDLCELIIVGRVLTIGERGDLVSYLTNRWGIA